MPLQIEDKAREEKAWSPQKTGAAFVLSFMGHALLLTLLGGAVLQYGRIESENFVADAIAPSPEISQEIVQEPEALPDDSSPIVAEPEAGSSAAPALAAPELIATPATSPLSAPAFGAIPSTNFGSGTGFGSSGSGSGSGEIAGQSAPGSRRMASLFGSPEASSEGLTGYLYDLKQSPDRKAMETDASKLLVSLVEKWDEKTLSKFYKVSTPLTSFQWFIPIMGAAGAPRAFNAEKEVQPMNWLIFYEGKITSKVSGSFRFVGIGDDVLLVRFNKKFVFDGGWFQQFAKEMNNEKGEFNGPYVGSGSEPPLRMGSWFNVRAGETYQMEVLIGEIPGNAFSQFLLIQQRGRSYEKRPDGQGLLLPIFQTGSVEPPPFEPGKNAPYTNGKTFSFSAAPETETETGP